MSHETKPTIASLERDCAKSNDEIQRQSQYIIRLHADLRKARELITSEIGVPYREFCRHPEKCAGLSSCPRDPCCAD